MFIQKLQDFVEHPITQKIDLAAITTATAYAFPEVRAEIHDLAPLFADLASYLVFVWLLTQIICKIVVTYATVTQGAPEKEDDE
jgi:hypothetical protein